MTIVISAEQASAGAEARPWMNSALSPDERAELLERQLTLDERIGLVHGPMAIPWEGTEKPEGAIGSAGYIAGVPRLGLPALQETDASLGVTNPLGVRPGDDATALPSGLALAASFDPAVAHAGGVAIGREARAKGFNVLLGGGINLVRDPRNGRNFEYLGEDPLLAGVLAGAAVRGTQEQGVVSTVKHFAVNGQETNRHFANAVIDEAAARESDLLAFQLAIEQGQPGSVMSAYNLVNGAWSSGNAWLLNEVLKGDWKYPGWVMSDWGAAHAVDDAVNGLDQQSGEQLDKAVYFGEPLKRAVEAGEIPAARLSDMVRRILRSMFAVGLFDCREPPPEADLEAGAAVALRAAREGIVLLKNRDGLLPLTKAARRIAVIGGHADLGVLSGGGSSQVTPLASAPAIPLGGEGMMSPWRRMVFHPSPPLRAIRALAPDTEVRFDDGRYVGSAVRAAAAADIAIVFANQWTMESEDVPDLSLPDGQDALIAAVAGANPNTVVVLQTGGPVVMPWLDQVGAVVEAWYSGSKGGEAIAEVLFGEVNPSGRLPVSFPRAVEQYPRADMPGLGLESGVHFDVEYSEGADVGYRRFARTGESPLFPFGHGLSYSEYRYSALQVSGGETLTVSFDVTNIGDRSGKEAAQVYLTRIGETAEKRLIGFAKVELSPGETRRVSLTADRRVLARFDTAARCWRIEGGEYGVAVAKSAADGGLVGSAQIQAATIPA